MIPANAEDSAQQKRPISSSEYSAQNAWNWNYNNQNWNNNNKNNNNSVFFARDWDGTTRQVCHA